jgi:hypothetical protein
MCFGAVAAAFVKKHGAHAEAAIAANECRTKDLRCISVLRPAELNQGSEAQTC